MATYQDNKVQYALFQAAKVGNISLMFELIEKAGADPYAVDEKNRDAFFYAQLVDPAGTDALRKKLAEELPKLSLNRQDTSKESSVNQEDTLGDKDVIQASEPEADESEIQTGKSESSAASQAGEPESQPAGQEDEPAKDRPPVLPVLTEKPKGIWQKLLGLFKAGEATCSKGEDARAKKTT